MSWLHSCVWPLAVTTIAILRLAQTGRNLRRASRRNRAMARQKTMAAKKMTEILATLKNVTLAETVVTVKSSLNAESEAALDKLVAEMV